MAEGVANFWNYLAETNNRYGTHFGTSLDSQATVVGTSLYKGGVLAFDQVNRKIAYLTQGGKSIEIFDYDFVQSWRVRWNEAVTGSGARFGILAVGSSTTRQNNVLLEITTNDIRRPMIKMPMPSLRYRIYEACLNVHGINTRGYAEFQQRLRRHLQQHQQQP